MPDTINKLSPVTVALHWLVGVTMISLLAVGIYMEEFEAYSLYPIHKSIGVLILLLVIPRVIYRIINGWPEPAGQYSTAEQWLSKIMHYTLIIATLMLPLSGMLMSGMGGRGIYVFGLELMSANLDAAGEVVAINKSLAGLGHSMHGWGGNILLVAIPLHIVGALKHHFMDKDGTLRRMLGKSI